MEKEIWYHKLNTYFVIFYLLFSFCLMGFYLFNGQLYYAALGLGGILLLLLPTVFERAYNCLLYTSDKQEITKIRFEPWHVLGPHNDNAKAQNEFL